MSKELLQDLGSVITNGTSVKLENDYLLFTGNIWPTSTEQYIPIEDCTHTFEYDMIYENDAGNYFYIGIERYNEDKATGSNNSCIYLKSGSNTAVSKGRRRGTVNLNSVVVNDKKTAYIRLRILNQWTSSSGSGVTAKIYKLSLREITDTTNKISIKPTGIITSDTYWEDYSPASFNKLNVVEANNIYEI